MLHGSLLRVEFRKQRSGFPRAARSGPGRRNFGTTAAANQSNMCTGITHLAPTNTCIGDSNNDIVQIIEHRTWSVNEPGIEWTIEKTRRFFAFGDMLSLLCVDLL